MRLHFALFLILCIALTTTACRSFQVEAGLKQPAELTATAEAQAQPVPTPKPRLGKVAFIRGGDVWAMELPDGQARRLTQDGRNSEPRWSHTGKWLAFRKDVQVWVMHASGADARPVEVGRVEHFTWSPVEDRLAYVHLGGIGVRSAGDSEAKHLIPPSSRSAGTGVTALDWSPDGQWIAFEKLEQEPQKPPSAQGLWRVKADGSEVKEVYLNSAPLETQSYLAGWSPDGQFLLFWRGMQMSASLLADGAPLMRVPVIGGAPAEVTQGMLTHRDFLAWSPDGQRLALVDGGFRGTWDNKAIAVAPLAGGLQRLSDSGRADLFPSWSPDGRRIALASGPATPGDAGSDLIKLTAQRRIWLMQADGSARRPLTDDPSYRDERPRWSADGQFILFARLQGEQGQLWLMRADGSEQGQLVHELTPSPLPFGYYGYLEWHLLYDWWQPGLAAPASQQAPLPLPLPLAPSPTVTISPTVPPPGATAGHTPSPSTSSPSPSAATVVAVSQGAPGTQETPRPTADAGFGQGAQSLSAKQIAFISQRPPSRSDSGSAELWLLSPTGEAERLVRLKGNLWPPDWWSDSPPAPAWSPDGRRLLVAGSYRLWEVSVEDGKARLLFEEPPVGPPGPRDIRNPRYSPDGRQVAFTIGCCQAHEILRMPAQGGKPVQVVAKGDNLLLDWHPDGQRLLYAEGGDPELRLVDLDGKTETIVPRGKVQGLGAARLSPDGHQMAVEYTPPDGREHDHSGRPPRHVALLDLRDPGSVRPIDLTAELPYSAQSPAWGPKGAAIVFSAASSSQGTRLGNWHDVWIMAADGSGRRNLTLGRFDDAVAPSWAPTSAASR